MIKKLEVVENKDWWGFWLSNLQVFYTPILEIVDNQGFPNPTVPSYLKFLKIFKKLDILGCRRKVVWIEAGQGFWRFFGVLGGVKF